jgi:hypothetical protein
VPELVRVQVGDADRPRLRAERGAEGADPQRLPVADASEDQVVGQLARDVLGELGGEEPRDRNLAPLVRLGAGPQLRRIWQAASVGARLDAPRPPVLGEATPTWLGVTVILLLRHRRVGRRDPPGRSYDGAWWSRCGPWGSCRRTAFLAGDPSKQRCTRTGSNRTVGVLRLLTVR